MAGRNKILRREYRVMENLRESRPLRVIGNRAIGKNRPGIRGYYASPSARIMEVRSAVPPPFTLPPISFAAFSDLLRGDDATSKGVCVSELGKDRLSGGGGGLSAKWDSGARSRLGEKTGEMLDYVRVLPESV